MNTSNLKKAYFLVFLTILYNLLESGFSIYFGISEDSIALAGFGVDSLIEIGSALFVYLRLRKETDNSPSQILNYERKATFWIGSLFLLLSLTVISASIHRFLNFIPPQTTVPGIIISSLSLTTMFFLWKSKIGLAKHFDSSTLLNDASCTLECLKLSFVLFLGSILYNFYPELWWADLLAGIILAILIGKEGLLIIKASRKDNFTGGCGCTD